jgi:hypothetical protein
MNRLGTEGGKMKHTTPGTRFAGLPTQLKPVWDQPSLASTFQTKHSTLTELKLLDQAESQTIDTMTSPLAQTTE